MEFILTFVPLGRYCDYNYADANHLSMASLISQTTDNSSGYLVRPGLLSAYAALINNNHAISSGNLTNLPGSNSWPILMATYVLLPLHSKADQAQKILMGNLHFSLWCLTHGNPYATDLKYIPIPWHEVDKIVAYWKQTLPDLDIKKLVSTVHSEKIVSVKQ